MTRTQTQIFELTRVDRDIYSMDLLGDGLLDRLSAAQRARLQDGIAQADRGEVVASDAHFDDLAGRFGFKRE